MDGFKLSDVGESVQGWFGSSSTFDVAAPGDETTVGKTAAVKSSNDAWGGFWNVADTLGRYAIAKDAAKTQAQGVYMPPQYTGQVQQRQPDQLGGLLPLLIIGGIIYAATR